MEEALAWPGAILASGHAVEGKCLMAWALSTAYGRSLRRLLAAKRWSRSTFYRRVDTGAERIAAELNRRGVPVR